MWDNVPLSCSIVIYMPLTSVSGFPREYSAENWMISACFPHWLLTPLSAALAAAVRGSLAAALWHPRRTQPVGFASPFGLPWTSFPFASYCWSNIRALRMIGLQFFPESCDFTCMCSVAKSLISVCGTWNSTKKIPRLILNFNHFRVPFSASIYSRCCKNQILQWQVSSMSGFEGT